MYVHTYSSREEVWNIWLIFKLTYNILKFYYVPDHEGNLNTFQKNNIMQETFSELNAVKNRFKIHNS